MSVLSDQRVGWAKRNVPTIRSSRWARASRFAHPTGSLSRLGFLLPRWRNGARVLDCGEFLRRIAKLLDEDFLGVLTEQRRALHFGHRVRHFDGVADREVFAAGRMVHYDHRTGIAQGLIFGDFLHGQDRTDRNVVLVADVHDLELGLGLGPFLDRIEDVPEPRQPRRRRGIVGIGLPLGLAGQVADRPPSRGLGDEVGVGVRIGLPALALENPPRLPAARVVTGARHRLAKRNALAVLAVFGERTVGKALLVAQLDAGEVEHAILHGAQHALAAAGAHALIERRDDTESEVEPGAGIANLGAGDQRRPFAEAGSGRGAAGALRNVLVDLAILVRAGAEALHRRYDHLRIGLVDVVPGEPHAVEGAGGEILHQHVAMLDQPLEDFLALGVFGIDRDRALVAVEHGEVEAVGALHVAQLPAGDVARPRPLDLDHVRAHVRVDPVGAHRASPRSAGRASPHGGEA